MSRDNLLYLALGMLILAALVVGISGWMLFVRDRRLVGSTQVGPGGHAAHPEAHEEL
jgi:hypothetical protein